MKNLITLFSLIALFAITSAQAQCCKNAAQATNCATTCVQSQQTGSSDVEAYYFHYTRRCVTCQSVEKVSSDALKELYGDKIVLKSINLDEKANDALAKKMGIEGQTLLVVKGTKKVEITNDGFMYARTNPEKLKEKIKSAVESLK
jgi:hypothetical protein